MSDVTTMGRLSATGTAPYDPFERLRADAGGILVVVSTPRDRAGDYELTDGISVADARQCAPDEQLVLTVYERALDRAYPEWRTWTRADLHTTLVSARDDDAPQLVVVPSSAAERYEAGNYTETDRGCRCEFCGQLTETTAAWVEHLLTRCARA